MLKYLIVLECAVNVIAQLIATVMQTVYVHALVNQVHVCVVQTVHVALMVLAHVDKECKDALVVQKDVTAQDVHVMKQVSAHADKVTICKDALVVQTDVTAQDVHVMKQVSAHADKECMDVNVEDMECTVKDIMECMVKDIME